MKKSIITIWLLLAINNQCHALQINEVFPNPEGKDRGKEWIELHNETNRHINLENWLIRQGKRKNKLTGTIVPNGFYITQNVVVKNSDNKIELLTPDEYIADNISYKKSSENLSLSRINEDWSWTTPTKNRENPRIRTIQPKPPYIPDLPINPLLLKLIENKQLEITVEEIDNNQKPLKLKILNQPQPIPQKQPTEIWYLFTLLATIPALYYTLRAGP